MKLEGIIRTILDQMNSIEGNDDFPNVSVRTQITLLQQLLPLMVPGTDFGEVAGTGVAMILGAPSSSTPTIERERMEFDPKFVIVHNITTGAMYLHMAGMADASAWKFAHNTAPLLVVADAITLGTSQFTIGIEADLNNGADEIAFFAVGL